MLPPAAGGIDPLDVKGTCLVPVMLCCCPRAEGNIKKKPQLIKPLVEEKRRVLTWC